MFLRHFDQHIPSLIGCLTHLVHSPNHDLYLNLIRAVMPEKRTSSWNPLRRYLSCMTLIELNFTTCYYEFTIPPKVQTKKEKNRYKTHHMKTPRKHHIFIPTRALNFSSQSSSSVEGYSSIPNSDVAKPQGTRVDTGGTMTITIAMTASVSNFIGVSCAVLIPALNVAACWGLTSPMISKYSLIGRTSTLSTMKLWGGERAVVRRRLIWRHNLDALEGFVNNFMAWAATHVICLRQAWIKDKPHVNIIRRCEKGLHPWFHVRKSFESLYGSISPALTSTSAAFFFITCRTSALALHTALWESQSVFWHSLL